MAVHMNIKKGSYLEITFPWVISETGYTTKVNGQLLGVDASTSLQYRSLLESETLEVCKSRLISYFFLTQDITCCIHSMLL